MVETVVCGTGTCTHGRIKNRPVTSRSAGLSKCNAASVAVQALQQRWRQQQQQQNKYADPTVVSPSTLIMRPRLLNIRLQVCRKEGQHGSETLILWRKPLRGSDYFSRRMIQHLKKTTTHSESNFECTESYTIGILFDGYSKNNNDKNKPGLWFSGWEVSPDRMIMIAYVSVHSHLRIEHGVYVDVNNRRTV